MKISKIIALFSYFSTFIFISMSEQTVAIAKADYFDYPCDYPFRGGQVNIDVIVSAGGQFCDGPTEINWSHYHCASGGGGLNIGGFDLDSGGAGGLSGHIGGIFGGPLGASGGICGFFCPDGTEAPFPNPPRAWINYMVLREKDNDCRHHMKPQGSNQNPPTQYGPPIANTVPPEPPPPDSEFEPEPQPELSIPQPEPQPPLSQTETPGNPPAVDAPKPEVLVPGDGLK